MSHALEVRYHKAGDLGTLTACCTEGDWHWHLDNRGQAQEWFDKHLAALSAHTTPPSSDFGQPDRRIIQTVCDYYGVSVTEALTIDKLLPELTRSRHAIAFILRQELDWSYPRIARRLGYKDHTSVLWAYRHIQTRLETDRRLAADIATILSRISS